MSSDPADLSNLKDLALPPPAGWWPWAPGWWILTAALLVAFILLVLSWHRRYRANAYRRAADRALADLATAARTTTDRALLATQISELLKRTALVAFPRAQVAGLSGQAWLAFLDRTARGTRFTREPANALPQLCLGAAGNPDTIDAALANARRWIRTHHRPETS